MSRDADGDLKGLVEVWWLLFYGGKGQEKDKIHEEVRCRRLRDSLKSELAALDTCFMSQHAHRAQVGDIN